MNALIRNFDIAMYHMQAEGKNGHSFFEHSMLDASCQKIALEHGLRMALEHGDLEMYYQPQVDVKTRKIVGAEALMRWNHPERGLVQERFLANAGCLIMQCYLYHKSLLQKRLLELLRDQQY